MTKIKVVPLIAAAVAMAGSPALISAPDLAKTRSTLEQWVELRKLISEEKNEWKVEKETLNESIELLQDEIANLKRRIEESKEEATDAERARAELTAEEEELKQATAVVKAIISNLERQTLNLSNLFPASLNNKLKVVTDLIPKDERMAGRLSITMRVQNILAVLQEVEKFNNQITLESEMQQIGGENVAVKTLYVGLGRAYYVDGTRTEAGILKPTSNGWVKEERNDLADKIATAVAIYEGEQLAKFINLPMTIQ